MLTEQDSFPYINSYIRGSEVTLQFKVVADIILPAGTNLFKISDSGAYPSSVMQVPAVLKNNDSYFTYFINVTTDGYIIQNAGNSVTEIWVCGSYTI